MSDPRPGPFLVLTGPTGTGKTSLSLELAQRRNAEIISLDSRQVYRELTIGTDKLPDAERRGTVHHFIDELALGLGIPWSAGRFADAANARISAILARGRVPLVVGGSTLYLHALAHGLPEVPAGDATIRSQLVERWGQQDGPAALIRELEEADPAAARQIDLSNPQRVIRALEVYETTGRPWSSYLNDPSPPPFRYRVIVLHREREALYRRIEARVDAMLDAGLVDENRALLAAGHRLDRPPLKTIGYQEPITFLKGAIDYDEMVRRLKRNTRRYAKRQLTWLRRFPDYEWVDVAGGSENSGLMQLQ